MTTEPLHAPLAPSSAGRWVHCARSPSLEAAFPEPEDSEESREGTAAHWLLAEMLAGRVHPVGTMAENGFPISAEMVEHVTPFVEHVLDIAKGIPSTTLHVETRVHMRSIHPDNWGTCDAYLVDVINRVVYVWDFKYGHGYVDHVENWQMIDYAQGVFESHGVQHREEFRVLLTVYQPRCYTGDGSLRTWSITGAEHAAYVEKLRMAAKLVSPNAAARTGPHCKNCAGLRACEANQRMAGYIYDLSLKSTSDSLKGRTLGEEYALLVESMARLKARMTGLEAAITADPAGTGWIVQRAEGREKWTAPVEEIFALGDLFGLDLRKKPEAITPVQARKLGLDAEVSKGYSTRALGEPKLVKASESAAAKAFQSK